MTGSAFSRVMRTVFRFKKDKKGATAIEYGLIAAGIAVAIVTVVGTVGTDLTSTFTTVSTELQSQSTTTGGTPKAK